MKLRKKEGSLSCSTGRIVVLQTVRDDLNRKRVAMVRIASAYRGYRGRARAQQVLETTLARYLPNNLTV